jgi:hypothetical protein
LALSSQNSYAILSKASGSPLCKQGIIKKVKTAGVNKPLWRCAKTIDYKHHISLEHTGAMIANNLKLTSKLA